MDTDASGKIRQQIEKSEAFIESAQRLLAERAGIFQSPEFLSLKAVIEAKPELKERMQRHLPFDAQSEAAEVRAQTKRPKKIHSFA